MIDFFRKNISEVMEWSPLEYNIFKDRYDRALNLFRPKILQSKSYIYTDEYLDSALSLFIVYRHLIEDKKAFLIALILNGLPKDSTNLHPATVQSKFLTDFFSPEDLELTSLFHIHTISNIIYLCDNSDLSKDIPVYFDTLSLKDLSLFNDFRIFFHALKIPDKGLTVIYIMNPRTVKYQLKDKNSSMDFSAFIESLFSTKLKIKNDNLKELFSYKINSFIDLSQRIKQ